jgi:DNA-binding CsgD family transcriptional regulator
LAAKLTGLPAPRTIERLALYTDVQVMGLSDLRWDFYDVLGRALPSPTCALIDPSQVPEERGPSASGGSALTCAELRLLPMLATHLTFPQIAATMSLSPNTIKSQAYSLYRKLGVSSRAEAVARSRQRALLKRDG